MGGMTAFDKVGLNVVSTFHLFSCDKSQSYLDDKTGGGNL